MTKTKFIGICLKLGIVILGGWLIILNLNLGKAILDQNALLGEQNRLLRQAVLNVDTGCVEPQEESFESFGAEGKFNLQIN